MAKFEWPLNLQVAPENAGVSFLYGDYLTTRSLLCYSFRWNNTPMDEALHFGHHDVFKILQEYQGQYTPQGDSGNGKENQTVHKNLDGLL